MELGEARQHTGDVGVSWRGMEGGAKGPLCVADFSSLLRFQLREIKPVRGMARHPRNKTAVGRCWPVGREASQTHRTPLRPA